MNSLVFHRICRVAFISTVSILCLFSAAIPLPVQSESISHVGAETCKGCHEKESAKFAAHSKMSNSFRAISRMKKGLTAEELKKCYECHTTGYGKPGGFRSETETPDLKNLGCEACHGPGSSHASSGNPKEIRRHLDVKVCESCHDKDRIAEFNYQPLLFGGAH